MRWRIADTLVGVIAAALFKKFDQFINVLFIVFRYFLGKIIIEGFKPGRCQPVKLPEVAVLSFPYFLEIFRI